MTEVDERLLKRERQFRDFQIWPFSKRLDVRRWLGNFRQDELPIAIRLANRFTYFAEEPTNALFLASVQRMLNMRRGLAFDGDQLSDVAFVAVEGEYPNASDSGNLFARKSRGLGILEDNILRPKEALEQADRFRAFVFVDDFVGSGNQMGDTWEREYPVSGGATSFRKLANQVPPNGQHFAYCACVCTQTGLTNLAERAPQLEVSASHIVGSDWNLSIDATGQGEMLSFLKETGKRAGYCGEDGGEEDWLGFHKLGLGLAFSHGVPDATLPIFRSTRHSWQPLISVT